MTRIEKLRRLAEDPAATVNERANALAAIAKINGRTLERDPAEVPDGPLVTGRCGKPLKAREYGGLAWIPIHEGYDRARELVGQRARISVNLDGQRVEIVATEVEGGDDEQRVHVTGRVPRG